MRFVAALLSVALLVSGCLFTTEALAQRNLSAAPTAASEQRVALVIGNSAYKESPLANPVNDATDIAKAFQDAGFKVILKRNATTRDMRQAIREFGTELRRAQVGLFYFAGHGIQIKGNNYLVPVGANIQGEADAEDLAIDANYALRTMEEAQVKVSIVILDACRNNPFARSFRSASRGLAQMNAATGSLIAFATAPGSVAADGSGRNGVYTKHLLASLSQPDTDILKVFQRTRAAVVKETSGRQTPWEATSLVGDFYFRPPAGAAQVASAAPPIQVATVAPSIAASRPPGSIAAMSPGTVFKDCVQCPEIVVIPGGSFIMGSADDEVGRFDREAPAHPVTLKSFALGKTEVTQGQFEIFASETGHNAGNECFTVENDKFGKRPNRNWRNPGYQEGDSHPATCISWEDSQAFVRWISQKTGKQYRLPSEAEWEYAARGNTVTARYWGDSPDQACDFANGIDATGKRGLPSVKWDAHNCTDGYTYTAPSSSFKPNAYGLYDMLGNVLEWTEDCWNSNYDGAPTDGSPWTTGQCSFGRVLRGGSWIDEPRKLRSAYRQRYVSTGRDSYNGFRIARDLP